MLTSENKDLGKKNSFEVSRSKARDLDWVCPVCKQPTTYVKRSVDGKIEHFRHLSSASHAQVSESAKHENAKKMFFNLLKRDNDFVDAELEKPLGDQIIDIYFKLEGGDEVAVEIQCTPQGKQKFKDRTERYDEKGLHTLWVLDSESFYPDKSSKKVSGVEFKDSVRWIQKNWFGRAYRFKEVGSDGYSFNLLASRLRSKSRVTEGFYSSKYYYSSIGSFVLPVEGKEGFNKISEFSLLTTESFDFRVARFYDEKWWN